MKCTLDYRMALVVVVGGDNLGHDDWKLSIF